LIEIRLSQFLLYLLRSYLFRRREVERREREERIVDAQRNFTVSVAPSVEQVLEVVTVQFLAPTTDTKGSKIENINRSDCIAEAWATKPSREVKTEYRFFLFW